MSEYDGFDLRFDDTPVCPVCGCEMEMVECGSCEGVGLIDLHEEDAILFSPGYLVLCPDCNGMGGWLECPIPEEHERIIAEKGGEG